MKVKRSQAGWGFWLGWVAASTVGMGVGIIMMIFIGFLMYDLFDIEWLTNFFIGIMFGIGVGILQWLVLRRRVSGAGWWVLASAAAGAVIMQGDIASFAESLSIGTFLRYTGVVALGGAVAGMLQWFVLRGKVSRAGWWVLASTVGWGLGMTMWGAGMVFENVWGASAYLLLFGGPVMLGVVTGAVLVWLLRQPVPEAQLE